MSITKYGLCVGLVDKLSADRKFQVRSTRNIDLHKVKDTLLKRDINH